MAPSFLIRAATTEDVASILAVLRAAFEPFRTSYTPEAFADTVLTAETLRQRLATMALRVAVDDAGEVVGTIGYRLVDEERGHARGMAVAPSWHGTGLAVALMETVERELRGSGRSRITLNSVAPLRRAIAFYERRGFRATGRVTDLFGMPLVEYAKPLR